MDDPSTHRRDRGLRPLERRLVRLAAEGVGHDELGRRFGRRPETIPRLLEMTAMHRPEAQHLQQGDVLRPVERRVLRWRATDESHEDIGRRFLRGPAYVEQVERLARYKLSGG